MKILITGGTGFIGAPLLKNIVEYIGGVEILNLTRSNEISNSKQVEHFKCDLSNPQTYKSKVEDFEPEVVIHLAWEGIPDFSLEMCLKNILSSISLIEIVTKIKSCRKVIVTGSCFEYNNKIGICNENDLVVSKDYFTFAKKTVLSFLELECNKNNIVYSWARLFYVYGPNQRAASIIPTIITSLSSGKIPDIRTPKNANDFIYVDDVASGILEMIKNEIPSGIYNLGSGFSTDILDISKICETIIYGNSKLSNQLESQSQNTIKTVDFWADLGLSKKMLNWMPVTTIVVGVKKMVELNIYNKKK
jgi:nucleoside-diphosphate-sugar epimerase